MMEQNSAFDLAQHLIGESRPMQELRTVVQRLAPTPLAVLIHGPTGAGKELVAQALHVLSRRHGRFVPVNVAAVPDAMFEDEFFGACAWRIHGGDPGPYGSVGRSASWHLVPR